MFENKSPIIIGCDHAAFLLKEKFKKQILQWGLSIDDAGTNSGDSVDYTDYGIKVASAVSTGKFERGVLLCGTGLGMSMVANRFSNVRGALCTGIFSAKMSRLHNDSNLLVIGARVTGDALATEILMAWLDTPFEGGRHQLRLDKFNRINE